MEKGRWPHTYPVLRKKVQMYNGLKVQEKPLLRKEGEFIPLPCRGGIGRGQLEGQAYPEDCSIEYITYNHRRGDVSFKFIF
jgi:hypothetical protein